jgi:hypothetical protein
VNQEIQTKLREPFKPSQIGKLPKIFCTPCVKDTCSDQTHKRQKCKTCKAYITTAHMHVKFVGHAEVTARLLEVDPDWNWEPIAFDSFGSPAVDANGGMWIKLTIGGLTRLGYGHADGKRGGNAVKETIGDALRNAAMRFGVALDLWRKEDAVDVEDVPVRQVEQSVQTEEERKTEIRRKISLAGQRILKWDIDRIADEFTQWSGEQKLDIRSASTPALVEFLAYIQRTGDNT